MIPPIEIHDHFSLSEKKQIESQCHFLEEWWKCKLGDSLDFPEIALAKAKFRNIEGLYIDRYIYIKKRKYSKTTFIHELNHAYQFEMSDSLYNQKIGNIIDSITNKDTDYWNVSWEVHSRIMELRYINNLKPDQIITYENFKQLYIPSEYMLQMFTKEELINILNNTL